MVLLPFALMLVPTSWLERRRSLCLFRNLIGRPCPGCGMTRAFSRAFHGDFRGAFRYNKRVVIVLPILAYTWVRTLTTEYRRLRLAGEYIRAEEQLTKLGTDAPRLSP